MKYIKYNFLLTGGKLASICPENGALYSSLMLAQGVISMIEGVMIFYIMRACARIRFLQVRTAHFPVRFCDVFPDGSILHRFPHPEWFPDDRWENIAGNSRSEKPTVAL